MTNHTVEASPQTYARIGTLPVAAGEGSQYSQVERKDTDVIGNVPKPSAGTCRTVGMHAGRNAVRPDNPVEAGDQRRSLPPNQNVRQHS